MQKRILIDARMYGLENSGIGRYIINLLGELQKLPEDEHFIVLLRKKYFDKLEFPSNWQKEIADFGHYCLEEQLKLPKILKKLKPDLVHFPHFNIPFNWSGKFVATIHDMTMHYQGIDATNLSLPKYLLKRIPYKQIFKKAVNDSLMLITPSNTVKRQIIDFYKINEDKINVVYQGYKSGFLEDGYGESEIEILSKFKLAGKDYFFYVGNAYPHKNLEITIQAFKDANEKKELEVDFVIAGSRDVFLKKLEKRIIEVNAGNFVKLLGFVSDNELNILYRNSVGFIYPSLSEGFGLQGLESIASGTVLLCSNIPIFREIYQSHAFYFNPKDIDSISATIYSVAKTNKIQRNNYLQGAQEFIKRYSWEKTALQTLKVYRRALSMA